MAKRLAYRGDMNSILRIPIYNSVMTPSLLHPSDASRTRGGFGDTIPLPTLLLPPAISEQVAPPIFKASLNRSPGAERAPPPGRLRRHEPQAVALARDP